MFSSRSTHGNQAKPKFCEGGPPGYVVRHLSVDAHLAVLHNNHRDFPALSRKT